MTRLSVLFRTPETSRDRTTHTGRAAGTAPGEENTGPEKRGMRERQSPPRIRISRARAGMHRRVPLIPRTGGFPHLPHHQQRGEEHAYLRPLLPSQRCCPFFCFLLLLLFPFSPSPFPVNARVANWRRTGHESWFAAGNSVGLDICLPHMPILEQCRLSVLISPICNVERAHMYYQSGDMIRRP